MSWPLSQDYNEAIQSPHGNFSDADLQKGEAVTNPLGIPMPRSGNFADVYELRSANGGHWAVKCFTREVPNLRERYAAISRHIGDARLPFTVDFTFLEQGIRVRGHWYPVLKMQWVEGLTLNEFVRQHADKPAMLQNLLQIWVRMAGRLREAGIAHADLQHGNVLLVPGITANSLALKLVDYDGMFVPALAGCDSGEVGHSCYQHPQRLAERTYNLEVDRFPLLLVAAALDCLKVGGRALWDKFDSGDNLLFREVDLQAPVKSQLFYELLKLTDERASRLVRHTLNALKGRLEVVPLLEELLPELHAPPASKQATTPATPKRPTVAKTAAAQPTAESTATDSLWDFEGEDKPRSGRRRKGGQLRWVGCAAVVSMAGLVLVGGIAALVPWHGSSISGALSTGGSGSGKNPPTERHLPNDASVAQLREVLKNQDPALLGEAVSRLHKLGPKAEPALYELANTLTNATNPPQVRSLAAVAISHLGAAAKPVVPALVRTIVDSEPLQLRQSSAEALAQMEYPANEAAIPGILTAIKNDPDPLVKQKCVMALFAMDNRITFLKCEADKALTQLLDEAFATFTLARYDAARKLAQMLRENAPDKTVDVLLHMFRSKDNIGDDARFKAIEALNWLGPRGAGKPDVVKALREAAADKDAKLSARAQKILEDLNIEIEKDKDNSASHKSVKLTPPDGFVPLFNGKDLHGWGVEPRDAKQWTIDGDAIVGHSETSRSRSYVLIDKQYADFVLQFEYNMEAGQHGVALRAITGEHVPLNEQLIFDHPLIKLSDSLNEKESTGATHWVRSADTFVKPKETLLFPAGEWHKMEVTVRGEKCTAAIDDQQLVDLTLDSSAAAKGSFVPALKRTKGKIGFQTNTGTIRFRNITIKEVPSEPSSSHAQGDHASEAAEAAAKAYEKSCTAARAKLLKAFDTVVDELSKRKGPADARLKMIEAVKEERQRFENRGLIPWSEPMRGDVDQYLKTLTAAQVNLGRFYLPLINAQLRRKNESKAADLRAELKDRFHLHVMARWRYFKNGREIATHSLYSNGSIGNSEGKATWNYASAKGKLTFRFPDAGAPEGVWIEILWVDADGTRCRGTNNDRLENRPKLTGVYMKDD